MVVNTLSGRIGLAIVLFFVVVAIFAPMISPYNPHNYVSDPLQTPSKKHLLGTNDVGQDILSELIWATRISILVSLTVGIIATAIAVWIALLAGTYGGWIDKLFMRIIDCFLAIPRLPLIIVLALYLGSSIVNIILVLIFFSWAKGARVIRAQVLLQKKQSYVEAALSLGANRTYIIIEHILPNILPLCMFKFVKTSSHALVAESGLAFLGIGDVTAKSWGMMFHHMQSYSGIYYTNVWIWWFFPPAICLALVILGLVSIGYSIEGFSNPKALQN